MTAMRIRDALDPLMVENALDYATSGDVADLRDQIALMAVALTTKDPVDFVRENWALHARIAAISPNVMLRGLYLSMLDLIESHTLSVVPAPQHSLAAYMAQRHQLHADLIEAIAAGDRTLSQRLIGEHKDGGSQTRAETSLKDGATTASNSRETLVTGDADG
jgi:DNA-binding GntR family transcriptional regulator